MCGASGSLAGLLLVWEQCALVLLHLAADAAAAKEEEAELGEVDESLGCEECGSRARGNEMLLCDNCDAAYHMGCLDPPLAGGWLEGLA